jgi:hypothetical protein
VQGCANLRKVTGYTSGSQTMSRDAQGMRRIKPAKAVKIENKNWK